MLSSPNAKGGLFLASSLCDGLEDNNIRQVATLLLSKDANPNILIPTHGVTPFHLVIGNDSEAFAEEVTKLFLRHGGDPNVRSNDGMTPVHVAAAWGRTNILQLLLANGGDPLCLDNDRRSPFHYAFDGKYFKAVTMLGKHCENMQSEDEKPKYNMILDKVLITNGDVVAEYVTSQDTVLNSNVDNMINKNTLTDFCKSEINSSSMITDSGCTSDICKVNESKCKMSSKAREYSIVTNDTFANQENDPSLTNNAEELNHSFIDLDFDFANLHLSDVMEKEKCLVNKIINHLSTTLTSDSTVNGTLHNYKINKQEKTNIATTNSGMSYEFKRNENAFHEDECYRNPKLMQVHGHAASLKYKTVVSNNHNKDILRLNTPNMKRHYLKCRTQSTSKKKYKRVSNKVSLTPTCVLDKSIISMSPNFNTHILRKRKSMLKTPLTSSHVYNDSIISKSPNFVTPVQTRKRNKAKTSHDNEYLSSKIRKRFHEHKAHMQYPEFNRCKKHIAQSTPRRKKRSIYRFHSGKKRFDIYRQDDDVATDMANIDKAIAYLETSEDTISPEPLDTSSESLSLDYKKFKKTKRRNYFYNRLAIKLDEGKYDEDGTTCYNIDFSNHLDLDKNIDCNQTDKKDESVNNYDDDKSNIKSESNQMGNEFMIMKKDVREIQSASKAINASINNVISTYTNQSNSLYTESFVECVDCDTKELLNEDLNMNINKTCNLHTDNWCNKILHEPALHEVIVENNSLSIGNLATKCRKQIYLPYSHTSYSSRIANTNDNAIDFKRADDILRITGSDIHNAEKNSSLVSYISTQEEYKYEDTEEGVILLERRLCVTPLNTFNGSERDVQSKASVSDASSMPVSQSLPRELLIIDNITLRKELTELGDLPGPITNTTRHVYLKRLMHLRNVKDPNALPKSISRIIQNNYIEQNKRIQPSLRFGDWVNHLETYKGLEKQVFQEFTSPDPSRKWREGTSKTCFTYLLLDSRVTRDLPHRIIHLTESEVWTTFLNAIFYIGKGKRSRPFAHLYDAFNMWVSKIPVATNKKISCILDIWNSDYGVICLHVFQNIIPVEAYTREAAMIDAMGTECLGNCKGGEYYGIAATWGIKQKKKFGRYLLYKALQILLYEGERQLFPQNL